MTAVDTRPAQRLKAAALRTFPQHAGLAHMTWDSGLGTAWEAMGRVLGMEADALCERLAPAYGVPSAGALLAAQHDPGVLEALPAVFCQRHNLLPLAATSNSITVATADPQDEDLAERARFLAGRPVQWRLAPPAMIEDALVLAYSEAAAKEEGNERELATADNPFVRVAQALMDQAVEQRASDLHIQPHLGAWIVRIRVDGELRRLTMLQEAVGVTLVRHLKVRSGMDPTNHLIPQDGRMSLQIAGRDFDLRVSALPASRGERMVIRFLDQGRVHRLGKAGFSVAALQALRRSLVRPSGMVLMTGPTGCGKTSTLYGMLSELNRPSISIITVENPVEYRLAGASQVEVNEKAGLTFQSALRSILRQDPDVILIGEIRDAETAEIATQAALTGHLVLSTLHTNDAVTAIPRLLNLGIDPAILADSLVAVAAQRLCRILCTQCRAPVADPLTTAEQQFFEVTRNRPVYRPVGCKACDFTGFRGRLPIVDILEMNLSLREAVAGGERRLSALEGLRDGDLQSLAVSGSHRILSGDTTVTEVLATVGPSFWPELAKRYGTQVPEDAVTASVEGQSAGQAVLLVSRNPAVAERLGPALEALGLRLQVCDNASAASELLHRDEAISFILGDVPDRQGADELADTLREFRVAVSWARLPTLVLLPQALAGQMERLRESGSMADFLVKPLQLDKLLQQIRRAHAR